VAHRAPGPVEQRRHLATNTSSAVIHEEIPKVPQRARETIHGRVKVAVRVTVDSSGNVVRDRFENAGPSRYFSRLASEAARKWKFTSADNEGSREWLLRFEFGRDGTTVHAIRARS
jgi:TonB family protein